MNTFSRAVLIFLIAASFFACSASAPQSTGRVRPQTGYAVQPAGSARASSSPFQYVRPAASPYGVNDWTWTDEAMEAMQEAGITWMRVMVKWQRIEPAQGIQKWDGKDNDNVDFYLSQAQKYGMQVSVVPFNAPEWARPADSRLPHPDLYAGFVGSLLARYPGVISAVEVLNEENTGAWPDTKNREASLYLPVLQAAYQAVKQADPNVLVSTSGLWSLPGGYLEDLYALGGKDYFDVVSFHYYPGSQSPATSYNWWISHLRKVMEGYGDGAKPIWVTEFGWPVNDEQANAKDIVSPQEQSDYLLYVLDSSMRSGYVQRVFWYVLRADAGRALIHATDNYEWKQPQPKLRGALRQADTSITVDGDWTTQWPQEGALVIGSEQVSYAGLSNGPGGTTVLGIVRGANGTASTTHSSGTPVLNAALTANSKRPVYYAYKEFSQAHPAWDVSDVAPLPDIPPAASSPVMVPNPGFEEGKSGWIGNLQIDSTESHSGAAAARLENRTGRPQGAKTRSLPVEPGSSYFLKAWVKIDSSAGGNMDAMVAAELLNSSGRTVSRAPGNYYIYDTGGAWREIHYPFRTPDDASELVLQITTDNGAGAAWFDDITVEPYGLSGGG